MKQVLVLFAAVFLTAGRVNAAPVFFSWGGEKIVSVVDFPDTDFYKSQGGSFIDAGIRFKQITVFFIPVWNYDVVWCGYIGKNDQYIDLTYDYLKEVAGKSHLTLPNEPESAISFWDKYGGKVVVILLFIVYAMFTSSSAKKE